MAWLFLADGRQGVRSVPVSRLRPRVSEPAERMRRLDGVFGDDVPHPVLSARQESIATQLREMIGEGPAAFFSDACLILSRDPRPAAASHIVAHLLREVESAVRWVLEPPGNARPKGGGDGHQLSIRAVLEELMVSADEPAAQFWLGVAGEGNPSGLAMRAHRPALGAPRPVDEEFTEFVNGMEELLDRLLKRFKARYVSIFTRLDVLLSEEPSKDRVKRLRNNFPQNVASLSISSRGHQRRGWLRLQLGATSPRRPRRSCIPRTAQPRCLSGPNQTSWYGLRPTSPNMP